MQQTVPRQETLLAVIPSPVVQRCIEGDRCRDVRRLRNGVRDKRLQQVRAAREDARKARRERECRDEIGQEVRPREQHR